MGQEQEHRKIKRLLGYHNQGIEGPSFIAIAGIHGNEPAGIYALERVFTKLSELDTPFRGKFVGVAGNIAALEKQKRYIEKDLNRQWTPENVNYLLHTDKQHLSSSEDLEQKSLLILFDYFRRQHPKNQPLFQLDLHTFSAEKGGAYCISPSIPRINLEHALRCKVPVIIGMEKVFRGTTMNYFLDMNLSCFCFEAGQHNDPEAVNRFEACLWLTLVGLGCLKAEEVPNFKQYLKLLTNIGKDLPDMVRFVYRHPVNHADQFVMLPGYTNFQPISKGELLAHDKNGPIYSPRDGMILMPLYQKQGEDGFFIVEEVHEF